MVFALAAGDCYLNGPCLHEAEKHAAIFLSIVALAINMQWAYLLSELAWFVVFARTGFSVTSVPVVDTPAAAVAAPVVTAPAAPTNSIPEALKKLVDQSVLEFEKHRLGDLTCDGAKWEVVSRSADGDVISKAEFPGQSFLRWRIESTVYGKFDQVIDEMFNFSKRAGPHGWDPKLASGVVHKTYDGGYRLCQLATNPMLGGMVSGREFVEVRHVLQDDDALTFRNSGVSVDEKPWKAKLGKDFPPTDKNLTRAVSYSGGGFHLSPAVPGLGKDVAQTWNYQLVNCTAIGGWIPVSTINSATGTALLEVTQHTKAHFLKKFA